MTKRALILWGGWDGHEPQAVAQVFQGILEEGGYSVEVSDSQEPDAMAACATPSVTTSSGNS